jgi:hypothetical protein
MKCDLCKDEMRSPELHLAMGHCPKQRKAKMEHQGTNFRGRYACKDASGSCEGKDHEEGENVCSSAEICSVVDKCTGKRIRFIGCKNDTVRSMVWNEIKISRTEL